MATDALRKRNGSGGMWARPMARRKLFAIVLVVLGGVVGGAPLPSPANVGPIVPEPSINVPGYGGGDAPRGGFDPPHHHHRRDLESNHSNAYGAPPGTDPDTGSAAELRRRDEASYLAWFEHWRQTHPVELPGKLVRRRNVVVLPPGSDPLDPPPPPAFAPGWQHDGHHPPTQRIEARSINSQAGQEQHLHDEEERQEQEEERERERCERERKGEDVDDDRPRHSHPDCGHVKRHVTSEQELPREKHEQMYRVDSQQAKAEAEAVSEAPSPVKRHLDGEEKIPDWFGYIGSPDSGSGVGRAHQSDRARRETSHEEAKVASTAAKSVRVARDAPAADWKLFLSAQF